MEQDQAKNILGGEFQVCCTNPMSGFLRGGYCHPHEHDYGTHLFCAIVTEELLNFTQSHGDDLKTPRTEYRFPGLKAGDGRCLCSLR